MTVTFGQSSDLSRLQMVVGLCAWEAEILKSRRVRRVAMTALHMGNITQRQYETILLVNRLNRRYRHVETCRLWRGMNDKLLDIWCRSQRVDPHSVSAVLGELAVSEQVLFVCHGRNGSLKIYPSTGLRKAILGSA